MTIELIVNFPKCQTANGCKFLIKRLRVGMIYCQMGTYHALRHGLPSIGILVRSPSILSSRGEFCVSNSHALLAAAASITGLLIARGARIVHSVSSLLNTAHHKITTQRSPLSYVTRSKVRLLKKQLNRVKPILQSNHSVAD